MFFVVALLFLAAALRLTDRFRHRRGNFVTVQNRFTVDVTRGAADGLNQRTLGTQEALFIRVQNRHQRNLRHIQTFPQQVNPHQHVKLAQAQVADNLHALHGIDIRVQITHLLAVLFEILGQVFRHTLGERGHQHALVNGGTGADLREQVVHLRGYRTHLDNRIQQPGRTHYLVNHLIARFFQLIVARRGRDVDGLRRQRLKLFELHRAVIQR